MFAVWDPSDWLSGELDNGAEAGAQVGLYGVEGGGTEEYPQMAESQLRALAAGRFGYPSSRASIEANLARIDVQKATSLDRIRNSTVWTPDFSGLQRGVFAIGWRACVIVFTLLGVAGLLLRMQTLREWLMLSLCAVAFVAVAPFVPGILRSGLSVVRHILGLTWHIAAVACIAIRGVAFRRRLARVEQMEQWVSTYLDHLLANYRFHKRLAQKARRAA